MCEDSFDEDSVSSAAYENLYKDFQAGIAPPDFDRLENYRRWIKNRISLAAVAMTLIQDRWVKTDDYHFTNKDGLPVVMVCISGPDHGEGTHSKFYFEYADFFSDKSLIEVVQKFNRKKKADDRRKKDEESRLRHERTEIAQKSREDKVRDTLANLSKAFPHLVAEAAKNI